MTKEFMLAKLNKLYREDPWIGELFNAAGVTLDSVADSILDLYQGQFFDVARERAIQVHEKLLDLHPRDGMTLDERRSAIQAKWKSGGKVDLALIQSICDSWRNGETEVTFFGSTISIEFTSVHGVPSDLDGLEMAIDEVKPAHLVVAYIILYLLIRDIDAMTVAEVSALTLDQFAGGS